MENGSATELVLEMINSRRRISRYEVESIDLPAALYDRVTAEMKELATIPNENWRPGDPPRIGGVAIYRREP